MPVEQIKLSRAGTGLRAWDREQAWPGYTLFAPYQSRDTTVYLIDLDGTPVHTWRMPYPAQYGRLTERGTLLYNGKTPGEPHLLVLVGPTPSRLAHGARVRTI